ncbi:hypothetical protein LPJ61_005451 [Coemansia biformis]|uniref:Uncharacterized protein n=1 Tax=Coemansia biformis TaxID=1286918 RepID=A0A9W7Y325_9FUNG|nr:hypothetical protein LPJ61_005451 [Coemansia biformis]
MNVDMSHGGVPAAHARYARSQYVDSAYGQAPPIGMHMASGYEWSGYPTQQAYDGIAHVAPPRSTGHAAPRGTAQSLRSKIAERLLLIDREALVSRERRYQQKGDEIQNELTMVLRGTHPAFAEGVARLTAERDRTIASSEHSHQYLVSLYERAYRQEREQAEEAYEAEKQAIHDKIAADIEERRRRLREERDSLDITVDFVLEPGIRASSKRNLRKRGMDPLALGDVAVVAAAVAGPTGRAQNKRKMNQAFAMQGLPEDDIIDDLTVIRRVTGVTGPMVGGANGKKGQKGHKR